MTTSSPIYKVWHPSRGISFSPDSTNSPRREHESRYFSTATATLDQDEPAASSVGYNEQALSHSSDIDALSDDSSFALSEDSDAESFQTALEAAEEEPIEPADGQVKTTSTTSDQTRDPPYPALDWKVSEELFRKAKTAPAGSLESYWSYSLYRRTGEDGSEQKVRVHYCRSRHTFERVCKQYFMNEKVLGFDLEWAADSFKTAGPRKNVSLIQLASPSRIALFHVAVFPKNDDILVPPSFRELMEDPEVTKVGVAIRGDATRLRVHLGVATRGLMELSHMYKLVTYSASGEYSLINRRLVPLAKQVEEYLHLPLFKGQDVRSSDWTQRLNMDQISYSASDAYAGLQLYAILEHHRKQLDPVPPIPYHAESNLPIRLAEGIDLFADDGDAPDEELPMSKATDQIVRAYLKASDTTRELEAELVHGKPTLATTPKSKKTASTASTPRTGPPNPKDPRILAANDWVASYRETHPNTQLNPAQLRSFHIWNFNTDMGPENIARILRDPPLKTATVTSYIGRVVLYGRVPHSKQRFEDEILPSMSPDSRNWYRDILKQAPSTTSQTQPTPGTDAQSSVANPRQEAGRETSGDQSTNVNDERQ